MMIPRPPYLVIIAGSALCGVLLAFVLRPTYVIDWPLDQRQGARLFVDGHDVKISTANPLELKASWFTKSITLKRSGFAPIQIDLPTLSNLFVDQDVLPEWIPSENQLITRSLNELGEKAVAKLISGQAASHFVAERNELLELTRQLRPDFDSDHIAFADAISDLLAELPHPLDAADDPSHSTRVWRLGSAMLRHSKPVKTVAISPSGELLASGSEDAGILIHDLQNGQPLMELHQHRDGATSLAFSPSGKSLISSGDDGRVIQWNLETQQWQLIANIPGGVTEIVLRSDGRALACAAANRTVQLWMLDQEKLHWDENSRWIHKCSSRIHQVCFLEQSRQLAVLHEDSIELLSLPTGKVAFSSPNRNGAQRLSLHPAEDDLRLIAAKTTDVLSLRKNERSFGFNSPPGLLDVAVDRSWLAEFQRRRPVNRVKLNWLDESHTLNLGQRIASCIDCLPNRRIAAIGTSGGSLFVHHLASGMELAPPPQRVSWHQVAFDSTGDRLILVSGDGSAVLIDCSRRRVIESFQGNGVFARQLLVSAKTNELWIEDSLGLRSIGLDSSGHRQQFAGSHAAAMTDDGGLIAFVTKSNAEPKLSVIELSTGAELVSLPLTRDLSQLAFGGDQQTLFGIDDAKHLTIINLTEGSSMVVKTPTLASLPPLDALRWIGGELKAVSGKTVLSIRPETDEAVTYTLPGNVSALIGRGWLDHWYAVTPGAVVRVNELHQQAATQWSLNIGSYRHRYSSVDLSPCGRFLAVALGNGAVEIHRLSPSAPSQ